MKVTTKGQVTIPVRIREYLNISPHTDVDFQIAGGMVILVNPEADKTSAGKFSALRGILKGELTTKKWMHETRGS